MAWVHLVTAPDQMTAELWIQILKDADIPAIIRPSDAVSFLGVSAFGCRVQVPEEELDRAQQVMSEITDEESR